MTTAREQRTESQHFQANWYTSHHITYMYMYIESYVLSVKKPVSNGTYMYKGTATAASTGKACTCYRYSIFMAHTNTIFVEMKRRARCGQCDACRHPDYGKCVNCLDKKKFSCYGCKKQCCEERKCKNLSKQPSDGPSLQDNAAGTPLQTNPGTM